VGVARADATHAEGCVGAEPPGGTAPTGAGRGDSGCPDEGGDRDGRHGRDGPSGTERADARS